MSALEGLRVCFVAGTLGQGGAERQLFYQLQTLKQCGAQPTVLCFSSGEYWQPQIEALGIPVIGLGRSRSRLGRLAQMISVLRGIAPHVLQSAHFYVNLYVVSAARWLHVREVAAVRSDGFQDVAETGWVAGRLSLWLPKNLATNTRSALANLPGLGRSTSGLFYMPNVVDTHRFTPPLRAPRADLQLLMVGRLGAPKRFDIFLRLLSDLHRLGGTTVIGHLVGAGPQGESLQTLARQLGLSQAQVRFHGAISDVERLYRQVDLYLHLSDWEGMPNTILEAMACGLPVIASRVGGIPELVQNNQTGFLLEPGDEAGLLTAVQGLLRDDGLRTVMGAAARAFIERHHALESLPARLGGFYKEILA